MLQLLYNFFRSFRNKLASLGKPSSSLFFVSKANSQFDHIPRELNFLLHRGPDYLAKEKCDSNLPCGVCHYNTSKMLTLKGLCFDELRKEGDFDTEYFVSGLINEKLHFRFALLHSRLRVLSLACAKQISFQRKEVEPHFLRHRE